MLLKSGLTKTSYTEILIIGLSGLVLGSFILKTAWLGYRQAPMFSPTLGFYEKPLEVRISTGVLGAEIRYTTDGATPTPQSTKYNSSLKIEKSTAIRAALFRQGKQLGDEASATYVINEPSSLARFVLVADSYKLFDPKNGLYTPKNWALRDDAAIMSGRLAFFENNGGMKFEKEVTFRIYGGESAKSAQKSLKLCAGENDSIIYQLFPDYAVSKFKCILLRNAGGDWRNSMIRDAVGQKIIRESPGSRVDTQNSRPIVLYINGQYWGIHLLMEYYNDNLLANRYGGLREFYSILFPNRENKGRVDVISGRTQDADLYYQLISLINKDAQSPQIRQEILNLLDVDTFLDYNIFQTFLGNDDWLENNIKIWRYSGIENEETQLWGNDGRFRWLTYDLDGTFAITDKSPYKKDILKMATVKTDYAGREWPYVILRRTLMDDEWGRQFMNRYCYLLNTSLAPERVIEQIDFYANQLRPEMPKHIERWRDSKDGWGNMYMQDVEEWAAEIQKMKDFAKERPKYTYEHVQTHFGIDISQVSDECKKFISEHQ